MSSRMSSELVPVPDPEAFALRQANPWDRQRGLDHVFETWANSPRVWRNVVHHETLPPTEAKTSELPEDLAAPVRRALLAQGLTRLYCHQREAYERAMAGSDVVVATPTASGKSLAYNLPVMQALSRDAGTRALYLFPTKALARDQEAAVRALLGHAGLDAGAITFDGDTPPDARRAARDRAGILISNPDMLHAGILPHHATWSRLFSRLRYVVVDEVHAYRGVFGSHLSNVLRRLLRVARFHGAEPQFLFSSATIGNAQEHASRLAGRPVELVSESGAPTGPKEIVVYNPPVLNPELGLRQSVVKASVRLAADLVRKGVSTLIFGKSRNQVEVMLRYLRRALADERLPEGSIMAYRGGYLPDTRRRIEADLRRGHTRAVVATNALELGIDVGALDAVVCAGYPGTRASTWQRFGRAGRRGERSVSILVTSSNPLDQYVAGDPRMLLDAPVEHARIDPDNVEIVLQHLKCGAFELPFEQDETMPGLEADDVHQALGFLSEHRVLQPVTGRQGKTVYHWSGETYPASNVSLRSPSWDNFVIIDVERQKNFAEMDFRSTHTMLHEQAIYQHDGATYQVERLDYENHKAFVRKVAPDYYTTAMTRVRVSVLEQEDHVELPLAKGGSLDCGWGEVDVVEKVIGYKKIKFYTHENVGYGEVQLPPIEKPSTAFWYIVPQDVLQDIEAPRPVVMRAMSGWLTLLHSVAAVGLMMDPMDLGRALVDEPGLEGSQPRPSSGRDFEPTLYLYDSVAGGSGLAARLFEERLALMSRARRLLKGCICKVGCPSCIGPVVPEADVTWSLKEVALQLAERLEERAHQEGVCLA